MSFGNPSVKRWANRAQQGEIGVQTSPASYKGVYSKTALYILLTVACAVAVELLCTLSLVKGDESTLALLLSGTIGAAILLLVVALVTTFVPSSVKVLGWLYMALQGAFLGLMGALVDLYYPGVAFAAFLGTAIVFALCLAVNKLKIFKLGHKFLKGLLAAFVGIVIVQVVMVILVACGVFTQAYDYIQLAVSAVCVVWATAVMLWDLQCIDTCVEKGVDKRWEWNLAFSLSTALIYLYIEILEVILRLLMIFGSRK